MAVTVAVAVVACDDSMERDELEKQPGGFEQHVTEEHSIKAYLFYLVYLSLRKAKDRTAMSAMESYVADCVQRGDISWFPLRRTMGADSTSLPPAQQRAIAEAVAAAVQLAMRSGDVVAAPSQ